jgi:hypothetical protein
VAGELFFGPDRPVDELSGAVGADSPKPASAVDTERALERADPGVRGIGRQVAVAGFAAGSKLEHSGPASYSIPTAREARIATTSREMEACVMQRTLAHRDRTAVSVGEKAVLVLKARNT